MKIKQLLGVLLVIFSIGCTTIEEPLQEPVVLDLNEFLHTPETRMVDSIAKIYIRYNKDTTLVHRVAYGTYKYANTVQVSPFLLASVVVTESAVNPKAISIVGARGLGQVMPRYWSGVYPHCGEDLFHVETNLCYSSLILKYYIITAEGDIARALQLYSGGTHLYDYTVMTRCAQYSQGPETVLQDLDNESECVYHAI
jgi:hypothetical protein